MADKSTKTQSSSDAQLKGDPNLRQYLEEIGRYKLLTPEEERELAERVARGDQAAREQMIKSNLRLVVSIAKAYAHRGLSLMDLIAEGNLGLLRAIEGFKPEQNCRFSTYATWWIRQAIQRALLNTVKTIRVPAYMVEMIARFKMVSAKLRAKLGRRPTMEEVAAEMRISPHKINMMKHALRAASARPHGLTEEDEFPLPLSETLSDPRTKRPEEEIFDAYEKERLQSLLDAIDEREATILKMRYGLEDGKPLTLQKIGEKFGLSRERVRQIEKRALKKLHDILVKEEGP